MLNTIIVFDLDGTITCQEILPAMAHELGIYAEMSSLTRQVLEGTVSFEESFRLRFEMLRSIPLSKVHEITNNIPLDEHIVKFIHEHTKICRIATGNLDCWIEPMVQKIGCQYFSSTSRIKNGEIVLEAIMDKGKIMRELAASHNARLIAIGDSAADVPMFKEADIAIAFSGVNVNPRPLLEAADFTASNGKSLYSLLLKLLQEPEQN